MGLTVYLKIKWDKDTIRHISTPWVPTVSAQLCCEPPAPVFPNPGSERRGVWEGLPKPQTPGKPGTGAGWQLRKQVRSRPCLAWAKNQADNHFKRNLSIDAFKETILQARSSLSNIDY